MKLDTTWQVAWYSMGRFKARTTPSTFEDDEVVEEGDPPWSVPESSGVSGEWPWGAVFLETTSFWLAFLALRSVAIVSLR